MKKTNSETEKKPNIEIFYNTPFFMEKSNISSPVQCQHYHHHNCYELYYLYSGERYYFINDRTYHILGGTLVLIKPYEIHCSSNFEKCGHNRLLINFKEDFIEDLLATCNGINPLECFNKSFRAIILSPKERQFVELLLETILAEDKNDSPGSNTHLKFSLMQLLLFINKIRHPSVSDTHSYANSTHKIISEVTRYVNNHYREDITLETISDLFYISPSYFSRTFKKMCGISFSEYLNSVRVKEACKLLFKTDIRVTEIFESTGFSSHAHFDRVFKNLTGMSPLSYRKTSRL